MEQFKWGARFPQPDPRNPELQAPVRSFRNKDAGELLIIGIVSESVVMLFTDLFAEGQMPGFYAANLKRHAGKRPFCGLRLPPVSFGRYDFLQITHN